MDKIRKTPLEEIKQELHVLYKRNNNTRNAINAINAIESKIETIKFLYTSELPPIEFSDNHVLSYK